MDMPRISKKESVKPIEEDSGGTSRTSDDDIILCNNTHDEGTNNSCHILGHVSLHTKLQKKINELSREMDKDPTLCSILDPSRNISQISNQNNNYADKKAVNSMTNRGRRMEDTKIEDSSHDDDDGCMSDGISVDQIPSDEELPLETSTPASDDGSMTDYHVMDRSTGQKCEFCGVEKRTPAELRRHLMKHTGERPFVCLLCDYARAFKAKRSLQYHQFSVHGIEHKNISERYPDIRKRKLEAGELIDESVITELHKQSKFEEEECGNSSDGEGCNTGHVVNGYEPIKKRVCQICSKVCVKPSDLKRHMMSHTGERPFKCEVCGKPFRAKNSMMYHLKSSHGYDVELSPGLEERFLKLKKTSKSHSKSS